MGRQNEQTQKDYKDIQKKITIRVTSKEMAFADKARGKTPRAEWARNLILAKMPKKDRG